MPSRRPPPLRRVTAEVSLNLHPSTAGNVLDGVRQELNELLLRFSHDFGGVVMAYSDETVLGRQAVIHPYFPYMNVKAAASLTVFAPQPGDQLVGTVNQVGHDYIGLLVLGVLNASITSANIRKEFRHQGDCWSSKKGGGQRIAVGTQVRFVLKEMAGQDDFFSMSGSLLEKHTGVESDAAPIGTSSAKISAHSEQPQQASGSGREEGEGGVPTEGREGDGDRKEKVEGAHDKDTKKAKKRERKKEKGHAAGGNVEMKQNARAIDQSQGQEGEGHVEEVKRLKKDKKKKEKGLEAERHFEKKKVGDVEAVKPSQEGKKGKRGKEDAELGKEAAGEADKKKQASQNEHGEVVPHKTEKQSARKERRAEGGHTEAERQVKGEERGKGVEETPVDKAKRRGEEHEKHKRAKKGEHVEAARPSGEVGGNEVKEERRQSKMARRLAEGSKGEKRKKGDGHGANGAVVQEGVEVPGASKDVKVKKKKRKGEAE